MQFLQTSAANFHDFLIALRNFLTANNWTVIGDPGGAGTTMSVANSNGHRFQLSTTETARTDFFSGAFQDRNVRLQYHKEDVGFTTPNNVYTNAFDTNDFQAPYINLWFFTDDEGTFCHVVAQVSGSRYTTFSFGDLDNKGLHSEALPFVCGSFYKWWRTSSNLTGTFDNYHNINSTEHAIGYLDGNNSYLRVGLPDGVLDPTLDFADGPIESPAIRNISQRYYNDPVGISASSFLDYFSNLENHTYTGGVMISQFPVCAVGTDDATVHAYIGEIPQIGLVNMYGLAPGQILQFSSEEWIVFPLKQTGPLDATKIGANPKYVTNSAMFGYAIRKA